MLCNIWEEVLTKECGLTNEMDFVTYKVSFLKSYLAPDKSNVDPDSLVV